MIVTLSVLRPLTEEATSWAMPRTALGSIESAELPSMTAAVAGVASSANSSSSGSTSCTCGLLTPSTLPIVRAISPSSARWYVTFCCISEAPSFCSSNSSKPSPALLTLTPAPASATRAWAAWPLSTARPVPLLRSS